MYVQIYKQDGTTQMSTIEASNFIDATGPLQVMINLPGDGDMKVQFSAQTITQLSAIDLWDGPCNASRVEKDGRQFSQTLW